MKHFYYLFSIALLVSSLGFGQVFITEISDPNNEDGARFVELYNAGAIDVNLGAGYDLQRWTNAGTAPQTAKELTGTIPAGGFYIVCNNQSTFTSTFGFAADQDIFTGGPADSNGDDQLALRDPSDSIIDFFGVVGEDGSGTNHEFEDGRAERKATVTAGNTTYTFAEWNIWNDTGSAGTTNDPQDAPADFDPGEWIGAPVTGPNITISTATISGLDYEFGSGPSSEQSFTVEGSNLEDNLTLTAPTNFEISDTSGGSFVSSLLFDGSSGSVTSTTVYVRLSSTLTSDSYNGTLNATSTTASKNISLSGEVTEPSCNGSATTFPFSGVSGSTNLDHDNSGSNPSGSSGESCGNNYRIFYDSEPSTDSSGNYIRSNATDGLIESADWGGTGKFETFSIDVSGETSIAIETFGNTTNGGFNTGTEQFQWWYKLDSGSETNLGSAFVGSYQGSLAIEATTINVTGVNNIIVGFTFNMNGGSDGFEDVNVIVTDNLVINGNTTFSTDISGNVEITGSGSLTLNSNASINGDVVINDGGELTLNGTGTVSGNATITDGGSLIARDGAISGTVTYIRSVPTTNWYLISSPVSGQDIDAFVTNSNLATGTQANNVGFSNYDNTSESWTYYQSGASGTGNFNVGQGHAVKLSASGSVSFTGSFNDANVSSSLTNNTNGFNLIGNPYTSYISVSELIEEDNVATGNEALLSQQTIWLWDQSANTGAGGYVPKNLAADLEIAPGQGFFVLTGSAGTFDITEAMQSHSADTFFTPSSNRPEINLTLTNESETRATDIYYIDGTTTGFDNGYDSSIFGGFENEFAMYTHEVTTDSGRNLGIQSLPDNDYENMIIPVGINATSGMTISISASSVNLPTGIKLYLQDTSDNSFTLLENDSKFTTTLTSDLNGSGRFYLYTALDTLGIDSATLNDMIGIYTPTREQLRIVGVQSGAASVVLYNTLGKQVLKTAFQGQGANNIALPTLASGVYVIKLTTESGIINRKIILN